jgi:hypothetical protein
VTSEYSSSEEEEEEESDWGQAPLRGRSLRPPHREPRGQSTEGAARVAEALARAAEASWSAVAATPAAATVSGEPSRKRKCSFSTLR